MSATSHRRVPRLAMVGAREPQPAGWELVGRSLPYEPVESLRTCEVSLTDLSLGWLVAYCIPGEHAGSEAMRALSAQDRMAFGRCAGGFVRRGVRVASLSGESRELQAQAVFRYGLNHHVLIDEALVLADELGLPTSFYGGERAYERVTFIARGGVVRHVFGGSAGGRAAEQALVWLAVNASGEGSLDAG